MLKKIYNECLAGFTVAIVALPLALAFGIAATGTSEGALFGLYGAIFAGFFSALFGGTPAQVTGPTAPITVIATGVIAKHGIEVALLVFVLAGLIQVALGVSRLGSYVRYIPYPVVTGFMNGIAIIIILGQLEHIQNSAALVALTIAIIYLASKYIKFMPSSLVGLIGGTLLAITVLPLFPELKIVLPFIGDFVISGKLEFIGAIPRALPSLHIPNMMDVSLLKTIFPEALSIALLGSIDSLLTSVVMDNVTGIRHNSNKELIGQGIGNIASGLFGGLAGAGATVRSVVNAKSGGSTALSACIHSLVLLTLVLCFGNVTTYIPMAALGGILVVTGVGMIDRESFKNIPITPKEDVFVMLLTMFITVKFDLMIAVAVGITISALLFAKNFADSGVEVLKHKNIPLSAELDKSDLHRISKNANIFAIRGPLYFASTDRIFDKIISSSNKPILILQLDSVHYIDASGMVALQQLLDKLYNSNKKVLLCGISNSIAQAINNIKDTNSSHKLRILPHKDAYHYVLKHTKTAV